MTATKDERIAQDGDRPYNPTEREMQRDDAGEPDRSVSLRQQISEAKEQVAAWPEWMTKSAKVHEPSCCARTREDERERCAQIVEQHYCTATPIQIAHAIRRTDGDTR
jgi:hypothetical protein